MFKALLSHARERSDVWIFTTMLISAILSLIASFALSVESWHLAADPDTALSCSVNVIINCASVMEHPTSELFGFPNPFLGLMAEPVVITVAIAGLAGVRFPRPFMALAQVGYGAGLVFAYCLLFVSIFEIGALCPWCLLVTLSTTLVFMSLLHYNIREENLYLNPKTSEVLQRWIRRGYDRLFTVIVLTACVFLVLFKYQGALFGM